jgi:hypothetical protein
VLAGEDHQLGELLHRLEAADAAVADRLAVARTPEELVPVVLQALDRVAKTLEPESLALYCSTDAWWLLRRLRRLGFRVWWPSWVMSSIPLPGLDRYLPTRPPYLL